MRFGDFSWIWLGYRSLCLAEVGLGPNLPPQIHDGVLNTINAFVVYALLLTSTYYKQNSKRHAHIFEVKHISGDNYRQRPTLTHTESRYGGHQTGGKRLSLSLVAYRNGFHISEKRLVLIITNVAQWRQILLFMMPSFTKYKYGDCETGSSCISCCGTDRGEIPTTVSMVCPLASKSKFRGIPTGIIPKIKYGGCEAGTDFASGSLSEYLQIAEDGLTSCINFKFIVVWHCICPSTYAICPFLPEVQTWRSESGSSYISCCSTGSG